MTVQNLDLGNAATAWVVGLIFLLSDTFIVIVKVNIS